MALNSTDLFLIQQGADLKKCTLGEITANINNTITTNNVNIDGDLTCSGTTTVTLSDDSVGPDQLIDTAVTAGSYTAADITVDAQGRITAAASGEISTSEIANDAVTPDKLEDTAVTPGQYGSVTQIPVITIDQQGRITAATTAALSATDTLAISVHNQSGADLSKGDPVYVSGTHSSGKPTVELADNNGAGTYPCIGLVYADITDGTDGEVAISGLLLNVDTSLYSAGSALYLDSTPGDLTTTRPTASTEKVQKVGLVTRSHATVGSILIIGAGRTNDVNNEITALTGVALNESDLGTFTGSTISDNTDIKTALQELETKAETPIVNADISATAEIDVSKLGNGTARQLLQTAANGTDVEWTSNVDVPGTLDVTDNATFDQNVTVVGDLTVNGTQTIINSTTVQVDDKNIELGTVATPTDATADGGGITLKGSTDHTILWTNSTDSWDFSEHLNIASGKEYRIGGTKVLDATSLGSAVVSSSLTSVGTITSGTWNGTPIAAAYLANTAVTPGSYTAASITVDAQGRLTSASSNTIPTNNNQLTNGAGYITSVNLGTTTTSNTNTITNDQGANATLDAATTSVAGLMTSSDKTKLDGIETGATADQTGAEIKTAYESQSNTNAFTDAEKTKLAGIAAGAEVNVNTNLSYEASTRILISSTGNNATLPEVVAAGNSGLMTGADKTKLNGIETGATADQTKADIDALNIDAATSDQVDIQDTRNDGDVLPADFTDKTASFSFTDDITGSTRSWDSVLTMKGWSGSSYRVWQLMGNSSTSGDTDTNLYFRQGIGSSWGSLEKVWTSGNMGDGSGLDADKLDGQQPSVTAVGNSIVQRNSSGYIYTNYFNTTPNTVSSGVTQVCVETGNDGFIRHGNQAAIREFIGAGSGNGLDADLLDGEQLNDSAATANTVVGRNGSGDIHVRLTRQTYPDQSTIGGGLVFRFNNSNDNFLRVCNDTSAIRTYLGVNEAGSIPQNAKTAAYTLLATDAGKHISITTGGVTVPSGVFSIGDAVTIYNNSTSNQTITASGVTLRIAGSATSGNKTLAQYGLATLLCVASNVFVIGGAGVS